jgi:polyisoprenoid-binding protein YceI
VNRVLLAISLALVGNSALYAAQKEIDPEHSSLTIHVAKSGLFSAAGHEHTVMAPIEDGSIDDSQPAHISFRVNSARLTVLPEEHQSEVQHSMQQRVLESSRFPTISFTSESVRPTSKDSWLVTGKLILHGEVKPISVSAHMADGAYIGTVAIKQTDFGIQPISAAGGTVRVKNELKIDFTIKTKST